jgi:hypothetical protein
VCVPTYLLKAAFNSLRFLPSKIKYQFLQFTPIVIGQDSNDEMTFHFMDPNAFSKSLSGKPKLK